jgi:hypothetical protein
LVSSKITPTTSTVVTPGTRLFGTALLCGRTSPDTMGTIKARNTPIATIAHMIVEEDFVQIIVHIFGWWL